MFATVEQIVFLPFRLHQFFLGFGQLFLHRLDSLTLCPLVLGVLPGEAHSAVHLCEILGAEDEHQLVLQRVVAVHIAHRLDIVRAALLQFLLKQFRLNV